MNLLIQTTAEQTPIQLVEAYRDELGRHLGNLKNNHSQVVEEEKACRSAVENAEKRLSETNEWLDKHWKESKFVA